MKVTALIPAYNEAERIGETIEAVAKIEGVGRIVVINDGSTDATAQIALNYPVELINLPDNRGKGEALNAGWQAYPADIYLLVDADLRSSAVHVRSLLEPLLDNQADMSTAAVGKEQSDSGAGMGFGIAKAVAGWGIKCLTGREMRSPLSGQRAVRHRVLADCGGFASGFGVEAALTISALRKGYRVVEIDLPITHRASGRNWAGFCHRGRQLWQIGRVLIRAWRHR